MKIYECNNWRKTSNMIKYSAKLLHSTIWFTYATLFFKYILIHIAQKFININIIYLSERSNRPDKMTLKIQELTRRHPNQSIIQYRSRQKEENHCAYKNRRRRRDIVVHRLRFKNRRPIHKPRKRQTDELHTHPPSPADDVRKTNDAGGQEIAARREETYPPPFVVFLGTEFPGNGLSLSRRS